MAETAYLPRLKREYDEVHRAELVKEFGYKNPMQVPRLDKVVINMGIGEGVADSKKVTAAAADLALIAGQKPSITRAKKSVANFKIREGMAVGCRVTLRRAMMYEFMDRLVNIALPRVRDFRGVSDKAFDGRGNYTLGITDQLIFPEVASGKVEKIMGMNITIVTSDNPRSEDPQAIIDQIVAGAAGDVEIEPDRSAAIVRAVRLARDGDVVLIAGKGAEQGQQFADRTIPFDDRDAARDALRALGEAS